MARRIPGAEAEATSLIEAVIEDSRATGQGLAIQESQRFSAVLYNGLGRYESAVAQAQQASEQVPELFTSMWVLPELIEAASRTRQTRLAADALGRLAEATSVAQTGWGQGIYARSRALLSDGEDAEGWYRQAVDRLSRTALRTELARAHLLYGEWLRRQGRRADARAQLRTAHDMFDAIGMEAFAERAASCGPAARPSAGAPPRRTTSSRLKRPRSRGWPATGCRTRRSAPGCSSARAPSSTTWARSSPSSISACAASFTACCPATPLAPGPADPQDPRRSL